MRYSEYIGIRDGFQTSVNLEYDLNNPAKVLGYIPTEQSVEILGQLLRSFYYEKDIQNRSTVLVGPYGRGKSHLLLVLTALTSMDVFGAGAAAEDNRKILLEVCNRIALVNEEVGTLAKEVVESNIRTLPVIINSNTSDISQAFLVAISEALNRAGLAQLLPKTYFDSAISVVEKWQESFPGAIKSLKSALKKEKQTVEQLTVGLRQYNQASYELFCKCYPEVAAGTVFNPMSNTDVVKLYLAVAHALSEETEYRGLNIIFDEFSKFLEANLDKSRMLNLKIIQDMAEVASRSGSKQIHFTCVTHKDILEYSSSDSFKTVEGRFTKIRFVSSEEQSYELIANAIVKKPNFPELQETFRSEFQELTEKPAANIFDDLSRTAYEKKLILGCFPLAPMSAYALLHVSALVGQNERTLFTFLAQDLPSTLSSFLGQERKGLDLLTVDYVYEYFEDLFQKEVFNPRVHSIWAKTDSAKRQVSDPDELRILKAIAIINIISDDLLKPVPTHIKDALTMPDEVFNRAINGLQRKHILSQRDNSEYVMLTANGVDVQRSIENFVNSKIAKVSVSSVLNSVCEWGPLLPREHNDKYCIIRYFREVFMEREVFLKYKNAGQLLAEYQSDGLIIHLVEATEDTTRAVEAKLRSFKENPQILVCRSRQPVMLEDLVKRFIAAGELKRSEAALVDPHYYDEVIIFEEDLRRQLQVAAYDLFAPNSPNSYYANCNGELDISRQIDLGKELTKICDALYQLTPKINNEMVNKSTLNAQNLKGRDLAVKWILDHHDSDRIPCMDGFGPEVSIFKSVFKFTGLDSARTVEDNGINMVLAEIQGFVLGSEHSKNNFANLYQTLTSAPYGMRKGVIPLFLAYILRTYRENVILYFKNKEVELSAAILSSLNEAPENYQLLMEAGTEARDRFLSNLERTFEQYADARTLSTNKTYTVVRSMQNWMRALPDYTKKFQYYLHNGEQVSLAPYVNMLRRDLLKYEINAREMLFESWVPNLDSSGTIEGCLAAICNAKTLLDEHILIFRNELTNKLTALFCPGYKGSFSHAVSSWYEKLPRSTKDHVFDVESNQLLLVAGSLDSYDDQKLVDKLVDIFVSIAIEDWNDTLYEDFIHQISDAITRINDFQDNKSSRNQTGRVSITLPGAMIERTFDSEEISPLGSTVLRNLKSVFDEYNGAISPEEQLSIIAKLLEDIIQ